MRATSELERGRGLRDGRLLRGSFHSPPLPLPQFNHPHVVRTFCVRHRQQGVHGGAQMVRCTLRLPPLFDLLPS